MTVSSKFMVSSFRVYHDNLLEKYIYQFFKNEAIKLQNNEWWNREIFSLLVKLNTCVSNCMSLDYSCVCYCICYTMFTKYIFRLILDWKSRGQNCIKWRFSYAILTVLLHLSHPYSSDYKSVGLTWRSPTKTFSCSKEYWELGWI